MNTYKQEKRSKHHIWWLSFKAALGTFFFLSFYSKANGKMWEKVLQGWIVGDGDWKLMKCPMRE